MERKKETLSLKTNLNDKPINKNLRLFSSKNFSEIISITQQNKNKHKNKLNISFIGLKNTFKNNSNISNENTFLQFNGNKNFQIEYDNNNLLSKSTNNIQENNFKLLLEQNYLNYTLSLKKLYPIFKFNHYPKLEHKEKKNRKNIKNSNKNYNQSKLLDILGLQENITIEPEKFIIKRNFLERTNLDELIMIKDDLVLKTGLIDKELNKIISLNTNKIYIYIENNISIGHKIDCYLFSMKGKRECKFHLKKNFIENSAKLFLVENKIQNLKKVKNYLLEIQKIKNDFNQLNYIIDKSESDNKIKEISDLINLIRNKIKGYKSQNNIFKNLKIFFEIEKELNNYENKTEEYLIIGLKKLMQNLFEISLVFDKKIEKENLKEKNNIEIKKTNFNLTKNVDKKDKDLFIDLDFEYENFDFMLIYNNIDSDSKNIKIRNNLISIMELLNIIIKDNLDIKSIIIKLKETFKIILKNLYNKIQTLNINEIIKFYIASNSFTIILSNYFYLLYIFQNNFGLAPKIFKELTIYIRNEMDIILKNPILEYLNQFVKTGDLKIFHEKSSIIERRCNSYLNYTNLDWYEFIGNLYQEFFQKYYDKQVDNLKEKLRKETWEQLTNIKSIFQDIFDLITNSDTDTIEDDDEKYINYIDLDIDNINNEKNEDENLENKNNEYILFKTEGEEYNSKHKIINFTLYIIKFIYESLFMYSNLVDENYQNIIVVCTYKTINEIILMEKDIIINSLDGKINGSKLITEKESSLLNSNIIVTKRALQTFLIKYPYEEIKLTFEDIEKSTQYSIIMLLNELVSEMLNLFNELNFDNYPIFQGKNYNEYIFKFTKMKKIYDCMKYSFLKNDIVNIFIMEFNNIIETMEQIVQEKNNIEDDNQLKQFRREMVYMKKVLEMFDLINVIEYQERIENISKYVNPNKIKRKKKKVEKNESENYVESK